MAKIHQKFEKMELPVDYDKISSRKRREVREEYVRVQDGLCYHCKNLLSGEPSDSIKAKVVNRQLFPPNFFKWPVHLHHNHDTGMTIGAVHNYCNAVLWQYHGE